VGHRKLDQLTAEGALEQVGLGTSRRRGGRASLAIVEDREDVRVVTEAEIIQHTSANNEARVTEKLASPGNPAPLCPMMSRDPLGPRVSSRNSSGDCR